MLTVLSTAAAPSTAQTPPEVLGAVPVGTSPVAVAINPATGRAFVVNKGSGDVAVLDLASRAVAGRYTLGGILEGIAVNSRTNHVVVAGLDGVVTVIDQGLQEMVATIPAGKAPSRVAIDEERNAALVTNFSGSNLAVIDLATRRVVRTIALKSGPLGVAVLGGKRRAVVACQYDMELVGVDLEKGVMDRELVLGRFLSEVAVNAGTGHVIVGNPSSNGILTVYDPEANTVVSTLPVGAGPLSVAVWAKKNVALVSEYNGGTVTVVDLSLGLAVKSIPVGKGPMGIAVHPESGIAVVVDKLGGNAVFLDIDRALGARPLP